MVPTKVHVEFDKMHELQKDFSQGLEHSYK